MKSKLSLLLVLAITIAVTLATLALGCSQAAAPTPTAAKPTAPATEPTKAPAVASTALVAVATKAAATAPAAAAPPAQKITIKAASAAQVIPGGVENQTNDQAIVWFVFQDLVKKYLGDRIDLQIFHGSQLGDEQATIQGARMGVPAQMASGNMNNLHPFAPSIGAALLPYMWKSEEEVTKVMGKIWDEMDERLIREAGVRVIAYYPGGYRDLTNSKRPVTKLDDLKGLKIRVPPTQIVVATYKAWGVDPVPIAYSELYQALQQKVIDGHDLPAGTHYAGKFYETQKYYTPLKYCNTLSQIVIGEKFFQSLPKDVQEGLTKAGRETLVETSKLVGKANDVALKEMLKQGLEMSPLTDEPEWEKKARAIWPQFYSAAGGKAWVDHFEELKK